MWEAGTRFGVQRPRLAVAVVQDFPQAPLRPVAVWLPGIPGAAAMWVSLFCGELRA